MGQLVGFLIGIAIISAISAVFIKLGVRLVTKQKIDFKTPFWISFVSVLAGFFVQMLFDNVRSKSSFIEALPAFVIFLASWLLNAQFIIYNKGAMLSMPSKISTWLLNAQFIKYSEDEEPLGLAKSLLVTIFQCSSLFIVGLIFALVLIAMLGAFSVPSK